jgi:hypothetical protein
MDGESFDRLSVVVHWLRDKASRRSALGLLLGGSVAAASGILADDAGARNRNQNTCRGLSRPCSSNRDCCSSKCRSGRCWYSSSGGGRDQKRCGGQICQSDWRCCKSSGVSVCVPRNYPVCCGNQSFAKGYQCCGGSGGACRGGVDSCTGQIGVCCSPGWKHCNSGFFAGQCIPKDWSCNELSRSSQSDGISAEPTEPVPTAAPAAIPADDWIDLSQ